MRKLFYTPWLALCCLLVFSACRNSTNSGGDEDILYTVGGTISVNTGTTDLTTASVQLKKGTTNIGTAVHPAIGGAYTITSVPADTGYTIEVSLTGYTTGTIGSFDVTAANVTGKDLQLIKIVGTTYTIGGTISVNTGSPGLTTASVQLKKGAADIGTAVHPATGGAYTITYVPADTGYTIEVSLTGYTTGTIGSFDVTAANVTGKNLQLIKIVGPTYTIGGTISVDTGAPDLTTASVQLKKGAISIGTAVHPATGGAYTIPGVPADTGYTIEVSLTGYTTGTIGSFDVTAANVTGKNLQLIKIVGSTYTVGGTISVDTGTPDLTTVSVQLKKGAANIGTAVHPATGGAYTITSVPADTGYTIEVSLTGYITGTIGSFSVTAANVTGKDLQLIEIVVPTYTISGTISVDTGTPDLTTASVQLKKGAADIGTVVHPATGGAYTIPGVPADTGYTIEVSLTGYTTGTIGSFDVIAANVTGKDLELIEIVGPTYTIGGTISVDTGAPDLTTASVQLKKGAANIGTAVHPATGGAYTIPGVPADMGYTIEVSLTGYTTGTIGSFDVTAANVTGKNLQLIEIVVPTYTIGGTISVDTGTPDLTTVSVQLKKGAANIGTAVHPATGGAYTIPGVPADTGYTIEVSLTGYTTGTIGSFNVTAASVTGKNLQLIKIVAPTYTISGTISVDTGAPDLTTASVQLKKGAVSIGTAVHPAVGGAYTITYVPADTGYTVEVSLTGYTTGTIGSFDVTAANVTGKDLQLVLDLHTGNFKVDFVLPGDETINLTGTPTVNVHWETDSLTVTVPAGFTVSDWLVDGVSLVSTANPITIAVKDFRLGTHNLTAKVTKGGVTYSKTVRFTSEL
ncbi:hypothetical protein AGMMS4952_22800 [Spirochaetia bacterium]|nr:hypothetical protein AGMMS4952_22800 [Spirochaetia bacterium]